MPFAVENERDAEDAGDLQKVYKVQAAAVKVTIAPGTAGFVITPRENTSKAVRPDVHPEAIH